MTNYREFLFKFHLLIWNVLETKPGRVIKGSEATNKISVVLLACAFGDVFAIDQLVLTMIFFTTR